MKTKIKEKTLSSRKNIEIKFHYEPETDIMYITRKPHHLSSYWLKFGNNARIVVDKDAKEVLALIFLNYYKSLPKFFEDKCFHRKKCKNCESQRECFAINIKTLMESNIKLKKIQNKNDKSTAIESNLPEKIKQLPTKSFACV